MISDFLAFVRLAKDLRSAFRQLPDGVGFSVVYHSETEHDARDHLRVVNLTPLTIHGFTLAIRKGEHGQSTNIARIKLQSAKDVFGAPTTYSLEIPKFGIYMRPDSVFHLPLAESPMSVSHRDDLRVSFTYTNHKGQQRPGNLQHVVRVFSEPGPAPKF